MAFQNNKIDPNLKAVLDRREGGTVPVIVQTEDGLKEEDRKVIRDLGGRVKRDLYIVNGFSADLPPAAIPLLALNSRVKKIYYDRPVQAAD